MPQGQCDICSAQLSLIPVPHTSGNMFVAECDYIVKLIPPEKFTLRKKDLVAKLWNTSWEDLGMPPYANLEKRNRRQIYRKLMVGLGRYAMEQWPHSHPTVRPCEVFNETFSYNQPPKFPWQLKAERRTAPQAHDFSSQLGGFHPWFHLPGRLYEYRAMYSQVPPNDSWVYRAYPPF